MKTRKKNNTSSKISGFGRRQLIVLSLAFLVVIALAVVLLHNNSTDKSKSQAATTNTSVSAKGEQSTPASNSDKSPNSSAGTATTSGEAPKTPYGSFVSSHSAGFNDSEASICTTSVGAKCQIVFSKDGVNKTLAEKTTDNDGVAYWSWKPQDLGLTAGSWQITATASQNGKTVSANDTRNLVIQP